MVAAIGSHGPARFGGDDLPKPSAVVMAYTGHSELASNGTAHVRRRWRCRRYRTAGGHGEEGCGTAGRRDGRGVSRLPRRRSWLRAGRGYGRRGLDCGRRSLLGETDPARVRRAEMKLFTMMLVTMGLLPSASTEAQTMAITRVGSRPSSRDPPTTSRVAFGSRCCSRQPTPSHASGGSVTFEPGARTAWHSHPGGQILIVTAGTGRVQLWGGPVEEIRDGDVVRIPPGQKHWHGASPQAVHDAPRDHRAPRWHERAVDGEGERRAVQRRPRSRAPASAAEPASDRRRTVGTPPAEARARPRDAHRRRAVRRRVEAARVVAPRPQPRDRLGPDRDRKAGAAGRPPGPSARQRRTAERGLRPVWRIWRSTAAGRARSRRSRSTSRSTPRGRSTPQHCALWARDFRRPLRTRPARER